MVKHVVKPLISNVLWKSIPPELSGFSRGSAIFKNHCFKTGGGVPNIARYQLRYALTYRTNYIIANPFSNVKPFSRSNKHFFLSLCCSIPKLIFFLSFFRFFYMLLAFYWSLCYTDKKGVWYAKNIFMAIDIILVCLR